jgi:hypothetical protein
MNRIYWSLVDIAGRALDARERDVVRGDLAEAGENGRQALVGVLGLIIRRQLALWTGWQPWLTLLCLLLPLAFLLSVVSTMASGESSVYLWSYANNWDWSLLRYAAFWYVLRDAAAVVLMRWTILACWSWSAGVVIGTAARRAVPTNAVLLCLMLGIAQFVLVPQYVAHLFGHIQRASLSGPNQSDFAIAVYRDFLQVLLQAVLVWVPALAGMRLTARLAGSKTVLRTVCAVAATLSIAGMAVLEPPLRPLFRVLGHPDLHGWPIRVLQVIGYWPLGYLVFSFVPKSWRTPIGADPKISY